MIDVHAPEHRIGGMRDFFMHLFTITVGLLIALGLENAAESLHHRHLRHEAEVNITEELRQNRDKLKVAAPTVFSERDNLTKLLAVLESTAAGDKNTTPQQLSLTFAEEPIPDAAWTTASSTGVLSYMDYAQVERFSAAYKQQVMLQTAEEKALDDYLEFTPILGLHGKDITPAQATQVIPAVQRALAHVNGMLALGQGTLGTYDEALK